MGADELLQDKRQDVLRIARRYGASLGRASRTAPRVAGGQAQVRAADYGVKETHLENRAVLL